MERLPVKGDVETTSWNGNCQILLSMLMYFVLWHKYDDIRAWCQGSRYKVKSGPLCSQNTEYVHSGT